MNSLDKISPFMHPQQNPSSKPQTKSKTTQISTNDRFANKELSTDKVIISPEAKTMDIEESSQELSRNALHKLATKGQEETAVDKQSEADALDRMIEELQEKIRDVTQQIATLQAQENEAAVEQKKSLEMQLTVLNAQLMELMGQKKEMLDQEGQ